VSEVPDSPQAFFETYLPSWFETAAQRSDVTSPGALVFHVGSESYSLRLTSGALEVARGGSSDAILQLSMSTHDFRVLIGHGRALFERAGTDRLPALRSLSLDSERAKMIRNVDGSVAFEVESSGEVHTLLLSPGAAVAGSAPPACTVRLAAENFWALSRGEKNPFELLMDGKIRIQGRMEVAMALSSVLLG